MPSGLLLSSRHTPTGSITAGAPPDTRQQWKRQDITQELSSETPYPAWYPKKVQGEHQATHAPDSDNATDSKQAKAEFKELKNGSEELRREERKLGKLKSTALQIPRSP